MNTNVQFYEKMKELQDIQHTNEDQRFELERQLSSYVRSDKRLAKLKALRLQSYWKKICEDEKKSQWRNEQLLRDFERVESHMDDLQSRSEKLKTMKKRFEDHVESNYPDWKEKVLFYQRLREHQEKLDRNQEHEKNRVAVKAMNAQEANLAMFHQPQQNIQQQHDNNYQQHLRPSTSAGISQGIPAPSQSYTYSQQQQQPLFQSTAKFEDHEQTRQHTNVDESSQVHYSQNRSVNGNANGVHSQYGTGGGSTIQTLSSIPTATGMSAGFSGRSMQASSTPHPGHQVETRHYGKIEEESFHSKSSSKSHQQQQQRHDREAAQTYQEQQHQKKQTHSVSSPRQHSHGSPRGVSSKQHSLTSQTAETSQTPTTQITQKQVENFMEEADNGDEVFSYRSNQKSPSMQTPRVQKPENLDKTDEIGNDSDGDLGSVEELPLSVGAEVPPPAQTQKHQAGDTTPVITVTGQDSERSIYASPEMTLSGLYNILSALTGQLDSPSARTLYKGDESPAQSVQNEIVDNANRGTQLNYFDSTSLSMVILDQLPLLAADTSARCILPDDVLYRPPPFISDTAIRAKIPPTSQGFWDKLLEHFIQLLKHKVMKSHEVAEIFAPHIIASDSPYEDQAIDLITKLLDDCVPDNAPISPNSTSTFSATPRKPLPQALQPKPNLSDEEEDDFFAKEPPKEMGSIPLTQSAAYRQMLGSTQSTQKSVSYIDSEDDDDDIEHQVASPRPRSMSGSKKKTVGGATSPKPTVGGATSPKPSIMAASPVREGALSPASVTSGRSSPRPLSPGDLGGGYVPSTMGDTGKSTVGQSTLSSLGSTGKKPAFMYGADSDTDEDIDLVQGGEDKLDDFDFYD